MRVKEDILKAIKDNDLEQIVTLFSGSKNALFISSMKMESWAKLTTEAFSADADTAKTFFIQSLKFLEKERGSEVDFKKFAVHTISYFKNHASELGEEAESESLSIVEIFIAFFKQNSNSKRLPYVLQSILLHGTLDELNKLLSYLEKDCADGKEKEIVAYMLSRLPVKISLSCTVNSDAVRIFLDYVEKREFFKTLDMKSVEKILIVFSESELSKKWIIPLLNMVESAGIVNKFGYENVARLFIEYSSDEHQEIAEKFVELFKKNNIVKNNQLSDYTCFCILSCLAKNSNAEVVDKFFSIFSKKRIQKVFSSAEIVDELSTLLSNLAKNRNVNIIRKYFNILTHHSSLETREINYHAICRDLIYYMRLIHHNAGFDPYNVCTEFLQSILKVEVAKSSLRRGAYFIFANNVCSADCKGIFRAFVECMEREGLFRSFSRKEWEDVINCICSSKPNEIDFEISILVRNLLQSAGKDYSFFAEAIGNRWMRAYEFELKCGHVEDAGLVLGAAYKYNLPGIWKYDERFVYGLKIEAVSFLAFCGTAACHLAFGAAVINPVLVLTTVSAGIMAYGAYHIICSETAKRNCDITVQGAEKDSSKQL